MSFSSEEIGMQKQEVKIPGLTGKFSLGVQNEAGQRLTEFCHEVVNTEIRLIIFFAAKDGEALYSQQKQDWELTVAQIMTPYCQIQT